MQEKRKRENKQLILKKLCAALLRSFRGQHSKKMKGSAWVNWDPLEVQQPFRPKQGQGLHHDVEAAFDWCSEVEVDREVSLHPLGKVSFFFKDLYICDT